MPPPHYNVLSALRPRGTHRSRSMLSVIVAAAAATICTLLCSQLVEAQHFRSPSGTTYPQPNRIPPVQTEFTIGVDLSQVPSIATRTPGAPPACPSNQFGPDNGCWWTCGACRRADDIIGCEDRLTSLTFDDGPSPNTNLLLDELKQQNIKATFCVLGSQVLQYPQILKRAYQEGHGICSHTWSHTAMTSLTNEQILAEIGWTEKIILETIGIRPRYIRPPYGDIDDRVRAVIRAAGYRTLHWNLDSDDWRLTTPSVSDRITIDTMISRLRDTIVKGASLSAGPHATAEHRAQKGFILLEHDLTADSIRQFPQLVRMIRDATFQIGSMSECIRSEPVHRNDPNDPRAVQARSVTSSASPASQPSSVSLLLPLTVAVLAAVVSSSIERARRLL